LVNMRLLPKLLSGLLLLLLFCPSGTSVRAGTPLEIYRDSYYAYRDALGEFKLAREEYLKWKTLSSRDDAVLKSHELLLAASEVLASYFSLLKSNVERQAGFNPAVKEQCLARLGADQAFLSEFKKEVAETDSLTRLEQKSEELANFYKSSQKDARLVVVSLRLAKLAAVTQEVENLSQEVKATVVANKDYPQRERILGDWVFKISGKLDLSRKTQDELWEKLITFDRKAGNEQNSLLDEIAGEDFDSAQNLLAEVINHLLEIVRKPRYE